MPARRCPWWASQTGLSSHHGLSQEPHWTGVPVCSTHYSYYMKLSSTSGGAGP
jgi:hypothetical protein